MIMVQLQGLYLRGRIMMEKFDSCDEHCFYIKLNTAIILVLYNELIKKQILFSSLKPIKNSHYISFISFGRTGKEVHIILR